MPKTTAGLTTAPIGLVTYGGPMRERIAKGDAPAPPLPLPAAEGGSRSMLVASLLLALEALRSEPEALNAHKVRSAA